jgi:hypothetical protein
MQINSRMQGTFNSRYGSGIRFQFYSFIIQVWKDANDLLNEFEKFLLRRLTEQNSR